MTPRYCLWGGGKHHTQLILAPKPRMLDPRDVSRWVMDYARAHGKA